MEPLQRMFVFLWNIMNLKFARWIPQKIFCHICNFIFIHIHLHIEIYICIYTFTYMFISICKYIYICIYIDIHTHIYIYTYIHLPDQETSFFLFFFSAPSAKKKTPGQTLPRPRWASLQMTCKALLQLAAKKGRLAESWL